MTINIARIIIASALVSIAAVAGGCGAEVSVCASDVGGFGGSGGDGGASASSSSSSGAPECPPGTCQTGPLCVPCCMTDADCDDGNGCTEDACNPGNAQCGHGPVPGCVSCKEDADCDDGNPCTADRCNKEGACVLSPIGNGAPCSTAAIGNGQCMLGECCFIGSCMDPMSGNCHDTCPAGTECVNFSCQ